MVHHYDAGSQPKTAYRGVQGPEFNNQPQAGWAPNRMDQAINRLVALQEALDGLRMNLHDRLMAAREPFGVLTPPVATSGPDKVCVTEGQLIDRIRALEEVVRDMSDTVAGFRELFG